MQNIWQDKKKAVPLHSLKSNNRFQVYETDKSHTTSSLGIPQDGNIARVLGCSGAI